MLIDWLQQISFCNTDQLALAQQWGSVDLACVCFVHFGASATSGRRELTREEVPVL